MHELRRAGFASEKGKARETTGDGGLLPTLYQLSYRRPCGHRAGLEPATLGVRTKYPFPSPRAAAIRTGRTAVPEPRGAAITGMRTLVKKRNLDVGQILKGHRDRRQRTTRFGCRASLFPARHRSPRLPPLRSLRTRAGHSEPEPSCEGAPAAGMVPAFGASSPPPEATVPCFAGRPSSGAVRAKVPRQPRWPTRRRSPQYLAITFHSRRSHRGKDCGHSPAGRAPRTHDGRCPAPGGRMGLRHGRTGLEATARAIKNPSPGSREGCGKPTCRRRPASRYPFRLPLPDSLRRPESAREVPSGRTCRT